MLKSLKLSKLFTTTRASELANLACNSLAGRDCQSLSICRPSLEPAAQIVGRQRLTGSTARHWQREKAFASLSHVESHTSKSQVPQELNARSEPDQRGKGHFAAKIKYPQPNNPPQPPWTPTHQLRKWKFLPRRMGGLLQELEKEQESRYKAEKSYPDFGPGSLLELKLAVPDNKGKSATFRGIVIARRNKGCRTTMTLRNHLGTSGAIEQTFPLYSPTIQSLRVLDRRRVRRAKLYYLRGRTPREYRV